MKGPDPLIWLLIDGLSWELFNRLRSGGTQRLDSLFSDTANPAHFAVAGQGQAAHWPCYPLLALSPNCQTPPSLFSIFSGTGVSEHGLTGYLIPAPSQAQPLAVADAFAVWPRHIPMVWDDWARMGIPFRLCAMPFVQPDRLGTLLVGQSRVYDGLSSPAQVIAHGELLRIESLSMEARVHALENGVVLDWADETGALPQWCPLGKTVQLALADGVAAGHVCRAVAVRAVSIEGRVCLVNFGYREVQAMDLQADAAKAYVANDLTVLYRHGTLGQRMDQGGEGAAEWLLLELMQEMHESFCADIVGAVAAGDAQRVIGYYPVVDLLSHHLLKYIDADWASASMQQVGQRLFAQVLDWVQELIVRCIDAAGQPVRCIAHSDHGMTAVHTDLYPNTFFERQGWLRFDAHGMPDLDNSAVIFHPADNGLVLFNPARLALSGHDRASITQTWRQALPEPLQQDWLMFEYASPQPFAQGWNGSCYWQAPKGTRLLGKPGEHYLHLRPSNKGGDHTVCSTDPWLRGVLIDASTMPLPAPENHILSLPAIKHWLTGID